MFFFDVGTRGFFQHGVREFPYLGWGDTVLKVILHLFSRRYWVSLMVSCIERVIVSAYMMTLPFRLRAARPEVCISERVERRNPSLSASRMATRETSGHI